MSHPERGQVFGSTVTFKEASNFLRKETIRSWGIERRVPRERSFEVEINEDVHGDTITLQQKGTNQVKCMNDFLPPGARFRPYGWNYSQADKVVGYVKHEPALLCSGGVFALLHEVGHAHYNVDLSVELPIEITPATALNIIQKTLGQLTPETPFDEFREAFALLDAVDDRADLQNWDLFYKRVTGQELPEWLYEARDITNSQEERSCWVYAITRGRELELEGFNVLGDFRDKLQVINYARSCLATYERSRYRRLKTAQDSTKDYTSRYVKINKD